MVEITHGGLWVRWSSLTRADKRDLLFGLAYMFVAGAIAGFLAALFEDRPALAEDDLTRALAMLPTLPFVAALLHWFRFCGRQDELFKVMDGIALRIAVLFCAGAACSFVLLQEVAGRPPVPALYLVLLFGVGYTVGWMLAYRKYR